MRPPRWPSLGAARELGDGDVHAVAGGDAGQPVETSARFRHHLLDQPVVVGPHRGHADFGVVDVPHAGPEAGVEHARADAVDVHVIEPRLGLVVALAIALEALGLAVQLLLGHLGGDVLHAADLQGEARQRAPRRIDLLRRLTVDHPALIAAFQLDDTRPLLLQPPRQAVLPCVRRLVDVGIGIENREIGHRSSPQARAKGRVGGARRARQAPTLVDDDRLPLGAVRRSGAEGGSRTHMGCPNGF